MNSSYRNDIFDDFHNSIDYFLFIFGKKETEIQKTRFNSIWTETVADHWKYTNIRRTPKRYFIMNSINSQVKSIIISIISDLLRKFNEVEKQYQSPTRYWLGHNLYVSIKKPEHIEVNFETLQNLIPVLMTYIKNNTHYTSNRLFYPVHQRSKETFTK